MHLDADHEHTHSRRLSVHSERSSARPLVIDHSARLADSAPRSAPIRENRLYHGHSNNMVITPASSGDRYRSLSTGHDRSRTSYTRYHHNIEHLDDESGDFGVGRRGRTRFPRRLVNKEAVEELGLPWSEEHDGAIVVLRALNQTEIGQLVDLTAEIRRRGDGPRKSVSFVGEAVIRLPRAPSPPPLGDRVIYHYSDERPSTPLTPEKVSHLNSNSQSHNSSFSHITTTTTTTTTEEPIFVPIHITPPGGTKSKTTYTTGSFPLPQDSLGRAEEKAIKAEEKAYKLEARADKTGSRRDEQEAQKARTKAEEKKRRFEEKEWKERSKRDDHDVRRRDERESVRVLKTYSAERVR
ncbi:hypothetical protein Q9L58_008755 [Maublancomyces gigas]|uniref:DUF8035 domain-containing protein n=1 Tax=Discina gigas TaxID=1032678 RepID=A0ABR3G8U6_9PEZI